MSVEGEAQRRFRDLPDGNGAGKESDHVAPDEAPGSCSCYGKQQDQNPAQQSFRQAHHRQGLVGQIALQAGLTVLADGSKEQDQRIDSDHPRELKWILGCKWQRSWSKISRPAGLQGRTA